jgi:hypothetical protein
MIAVKEEHAPPYREEDKEGGKWEPLSLRGRGGKLCLFYLFICIDYKLCT